MQLMSVPIAVDSRLVNFINLALTAQPRNFPENAITQIKTTYAQVIPSFSKPRLVRKPDSVKY